MVVAVGTVASVVIATLNYWRQSDWRKRGFVRDFLGNWASELTVPNPVVVYQARYDEDWRPWAEHHAEFRVTEKFVSGKVRRRYKKFLRVMSTYITACHQSYEKISEECVRTTRLPLASDGDERAWPARVITPRFVQSIFEQVFKQGPDAFPPKEIEYKIGSFSSTGQGYSRTGIWLYARYGSFSGDLAQITDGQVPEDERSAKLEHLKTIHQQMMMPGHVGRFAMDAGQVRSLEKQARALAGEVAASLRRLQLR
jgi:hypothetical protein